MQTTSSAGMTATAMPAGTIALKGIALCGAQAGHFAIDAFQPHIMGVHFHAGGGLAVPGPCGARVQRHPCQPRGRLGLAVPNGLHQRLVQAPTPDDKFGHSLAELIRLAPPRISCSIRLSRFALRRVSIARPPAPRMRWLRPARE
jgi:hypothetical protein